MKTAEKIFSFLYNLMGWCTWLGVIALLVFVTVLFVTGDSRSPSIKVNEVTLTSDLTDDTVPQSAGIGTDGLCRADFKVHIDGAKLSPYTFTAKGIKLSTYDLPADVKYITFGGEEITDGEISYSKISPADFTVSVYIYAPNSAPEKLAELAKRMSFTLTDMQLHFALLNIDVTGGTPSFNVSDSPDCTFAY